MMPAAYFFDGMNKMMVIAPVNTEHGEADDITDEYGP